MDEVVIVAIVLFIILAVYGGLNMAPVCTERINQCSYTYMAGKVIMTEYVSCLDTRAEHIEQVCLKDASDEAIKDLYYSKTRNTTFNNNLSTV